MLQLDLVVAAVVISVAVVSFLFNAVAAFVVIVALAVSVAVDAVARVVV